MSNQKPLNPFEHDHGPYGGGHNHDHSHDSHDNHNSGGQVEDPAQQSMNDALRVAFALLKLAMIAVVIIYLSSGFYTVPQGKVAQVVRFGKPIKISEQGGFNFAFPYPIDRIEYIEDKPRSVEIRESFWYYITGEETMGRPGPLNPVRDGSLITSDLSLLHAKASGQYEITDTSAYIRSRPPFLPGVHHANDTVANAATDKLVITALKEGLILAASQTDSDAFQRRKAIGQVANITRTHAQTILDRMKLGIRINAVTFPEVKYPISVQPSVTRVIEAETKRAELIEKARTDAKRSLGEVAGPAYNQLESLIQTYESLKNQERRDYEEKLFTVFDEQRLPDGTPILGDAAEVMQEALAFYTQTIEQTRGMAERFSPTNQSAKGALQQYRENPRIYLNRRWQEAIEKMLTAKRAEYVFLRGQPYIVLGQNPKVEKARDEAVDQGGK